MGRAIFLPTGTSCRMEGAEEALYLLMAEIPPGCSSSSPLSPTLHAGDVMENLAQAGEFEEAAGAFLVWWSRR